MWKIVENYRLSVLPPLAGEREWLARSSGGAHDEVRVAETGPTPEAAVAAVAAKLRRRALRKLRRAR